MPHWLIEVGDLSPCIMLERSFNMSVPEPDCIISSDQGLLMPTGIQTSRNGEARRKKRGKNSKRQKSIEQVEVQANADFVFCLIPLFVCSHLTEYKRSQNKSHTAETPKMSLFLSCRFRVTFYVDLQVTL